MKNIHVLPTDKPSRLYYHSELKHLVLTNKIILRDVVANQNIYITNDEEINENDYIITKDGRLVQVSYLLSKDLEGASKVILTTDQDLINDGVQAIDDEFLEWFVKNPSCEKVETEKWFDTSYIDLGIGKVYHNNPTIPLYKIIIPKEEIKLEEVFNDEKRERIKELIKKRKLASMMQDDEELGLYEEPHNLLLGFINQFEEGGEYQELTNEDWSVSQFLKWLKSNNFKIIK
jgi:hypothetical protein